LDITVSLFKLTTKKIERLTEGIYLPRLMTEDTVGLYLGVASIMLGINSYISLKKRESEKKEKK